MGAVLLLLFYLLLAGGFGVVAGRSGVSGRAVLLLSSLPLAFTASGFLPQKTLATTVSLGGVAPWASPPLEEVFREGSTRGNSELFDSVTQFEPWRRAAREDLLLNPAQGAGAALLANGQSAVLFPLELLARRLPPSRATTLVQAGRLLLAVWGTFLLARFLGAGELAALVAASAFLGTGMLQLWRTSPIGTLVALAPWIVWLVLRAVREPGPRPAAALALMGALGVYGGHPETLLHTLVLALLLSIPFWRREAVGRAVAWGAVAAGLAFLLAAPLLLPFLENLLVSAEWAARSAGAAAKPGSSWSGALHRMIPAVALPALGDLLGAGWQGIEGPTETGGAATSLSCLALALLALRDRSRRWVSWWLAVGALGLLVAARVPGLEAAFASLPLLGMTLLKRLSSWWALAVSVVTGFGAEHLLRRRSGVVVPLLAFSGSLALLAVAAALAGPADEIPRTLVWILLALLPLGASGIAARARRCPPAPVRALLVLALLLPQMYLFGRWVPVSTALSFYPETAAVRWVRERAEGWRVTGRDAALLPHAAAFYGLEEVRAYDPMTFAPYERFLDAAGEKPRIGWHRILELDRPVLDFLGVRYVFDHPYHGERAGARKVYQGYDAVVYENPDALPRLFFPRAVEVVAGHEAALEVARSRQDYGSRVAISGPVMQESGPRSNPEARVVTLRFPAAGRVDAEVWTRGEAVLVSSQPAIPGWRARVDGEEAELLRAYGAFCALRVPAGRHRVELVYDPASWDVGRALAAIGGLLLLVAAGWPFRLSRPDRRPRARAEAGS